jgi:hypothetical protein
MLSEILEDVTDTVVEESRERGGAKMNEVNTLFSLVTSL